MKPINTFITFILIAATASCNNSAPTRNDGVSNMSVKESVELNAPPVAGNASVNEPIPTPRPTEQGIAKKIIKDGNMSIKTNDMVASKKHMDELVKQTGAYYEQEDLKNDEYRITYELKIRIPAAGFEQLLEGIEKGEDEITEKSIQARDVTEEYVDIETRLANKRAYLKRYQELLSKARDVEEILKVEENIRALEEEIESAEGRLKYLGDQVAYSTLSVNLFRDKEYVYKPQHQDQFTERVKKAFSNGWTFVVELLLFIINGWAVFLLMIIAFYLIRKRMRKNRAGKS